MELEGNQIDLLISILVRFPQIGTVHYEPEEKALRLVFLIKDSRVDFALFVQNFESHLSLFHSFRQEQVLVASVKRIIKDELVALEVTRDLASLSLSELNLITELINDSFEESLVREGPDMVDEDEWEQNMLIESLLSSASWRGLERLTGYRENGRVLVFSIPFKEVTES